jgi:hypothetical protein
MCISIPSYPGDLPLHSSGTVARRRKRMPTLSAAEGESCKLHYPRFPILRPPQIMAGSAFKKLQSLQNSILSVRLMQAFSTEFLVFQSGFDTKSRFPGKTAL